MMFAYVVFCLTMTGMILYSLFMDNNRPPTGRLVVA